MHFKVVDYGGENGVKIKSKPKVKVVLEFQGFAGCPNLLLKLYIPILEASFQLMDALEFVCQVFLLELGFEEIKGLQGRKPLQITLSSCLKDNIRRVFGGLIQGLHLCFSLMYFEEVLRSQRTNLMQISSATENKGQKSRFISAWCGYAFFLSLMCFFGVFGEFLSPFLGVACWT